jgi:hypothetical protein
MNKAVGHSPPGYEPLPNEPLNLRKQQMVLSHTGVSVAQAVRSFTI